MRKGKYILIISSLLIFISIIVYFILNKYIKRKSSQIPTTYLKEKTLIGYDVSDQNYFLSNPEDIVIDEDNNFYIVDSQKNCILKYDSNYKFIKEIGRTGQGPGELLRPGDAYYRNGKLYVMDCGSFRVSIFNKDGKFLNSFPTSPIIVGQQIAVSIDGERIYINEPTPMRKRLFTVYNEKGEILQKFGELELTNSGMNVFSNNEVRFDIDRRDNIYVFYCHKPEVRKYNRNGKLLFKAQLKVLEITERKRILKNDNKADRANYVNDVCYCNNRLFLLTPLVPSLKKENIKFVMYEFDLDFNPIQRYLAKKSADIEWYCDSAVINKKREIYGVNSIGCTFSKYVIER